jgi:hypothetical protein
MPRRPKTDPVKAFLAKIGSKGGKAGEARRKRALAPGPYGGEAMVGTAGLRRLNPFRSRIPSMRRHDFACFVMNANFCFVRATVKLRVSDGVLDRVCSAVFNFPNGNCRKSVRRRFSSLGLRKDACGVSHGAAECTGVGLGLVDCGARAELVSSFNRSHTAQKMRTTAAATTSAIPSAVLTTLPNTNPNLSVCQVAVTRPVPDSCVSTTRPRCQFSTFWLVQAPTVHCPLGRNSPIATISLIWPRYIGDEALSCRITANVAFGSFRSTSTHFLSPRFSTVANQNPDALVA